MKWNDLVDRFCGRGQLLQMVTQWPETLEEFYSLYPEVKEQPVERFEMLMGPAASGINMVIDSLPHVLSMVHCLTGIGEVQNPRADHKNPEQMKVSFEYWHAAGRLDVAVDLVRTPESPRPAGYAINGHAVRRIHPSSRISNEVYWGTGKRSGIGRSVEETCPELYWPISKAGSPPTKNNWSRR